MSILRRITSVERHEAGTVAALSFYFFATIACYWFLKPMRSALTVGFLGADAIALLKVITAVVSAGVVVAYAAAAKRIGRRKLAALVLGSFFWMFMLASVLLLLPQPPREAFFAFHVSVDLFITVNVALFWGMVADVVEVGSAHRLYGWIGMGGVVGGLVGSLSCHAFVTLIEPWAMTALVAGMNLGLIGLSLWILRPKVRRATTPLAALPVAAVAATRAVSARELAVYVASIGVMVAGYEFASALSDFTLHKSVELLFSQRGELPSLGGLLTLLAPQGVSDGVAEFLGFVGLETEHASLGGFFAEFFLVLNLAAVGLQLLLTPWVLGRWGAARAVLLLPAVFALLGGGFLVMPSLGLAALMFASDNSLNYSLNQTARQMLFVRVPATGKYGALAVTDILVQRTAKALAGFALLGFSAMDLASSFGSLRWAMALMLPIVVLWWIAARRAGTTYRDMGSGTPVSGPPDKSIQDKGT